VSQDRTEAPTARRRRKARDEGQIARSSELVGAGILLGLLCSLHSLIPTLASQAGEYWVRTFQAAGRGSMSAGALDQLAGLCFFQVGKMAGPVLGLVAAGALATNLMQVGFSFNTSRLQPNFGRLDPLKGIGRLFTPRSGVELIKGFIKVGVVATVGWHYFSGHRDSLALLAVTDPVLIAPHVGELTYGMALRMVATLALVAAADYTYQRWQLERSLRMTKQEVRDEIKEAEGSPETKARIRQRQRETARRRMMTAVPRASVVITNPTHFAVALEYEMGQKGAPKVVAKGQDLLAHRIREIAEAHHVPLVENAPLARSIYQSVEIDEEIPPELYRAVAEVLALVWRTSQRLAGGA
jgi:flagellar biosynthetic protein FlhB